MAVDGVIVVGCEETCVKLVDFGVMVLAVDSSFGGVFVWSWVVWRNGLLVEWLLCWP